MGIYDVNRLIAETRRLAAEYRKATGKALPVSSEIAKHDACTCLSLEPVEAGQEGGYDAVGKHPAWQGLRCQVKGRAIFDESKSGQRVGQLKLDRQWDAVVLVLMNEEFISQEMYMAHRDEIEDELKDAESKRKNRGAMSVARFKHLGRLVWTQVDGIITDEIWSNESGS